MLKRIRKHYGISQDTLAMCLGVKRSRLSMAEIRGNDLSGVIPEILTPLYMAIYKPPAEKQKNELLDQQVSAQKKKLEEEIEWKQKSALYKLGQLKKQLTAMKEDQERAVLILMSIESLQTKTSKRKELKLLDIIEIKALDLQKKTSVYAQLKLELQIQSLQAEVRYLKAISC